MRLFTSFLAASDVDRDLIMVTKQREPSTPRDAVAWNTANQLRQLRRTAAAPASSKAAAADADSQRWIVFSSLPSILDSETLRPLSRKL